MSHEHDVGEAKNVLDERDRLASENAALRERVEALEAENAKCRRVNEELDDERQALWKVRDDLWAERDRLREALIGVSVHHYEPQFGGYCWCIAERRDAHDAHDLDCLAARAALAAHEPQGGSADG